MRTVIPAVVGLFLIFCIHAVLPSYFNGKQRNENFRIAPLWDNDSAALFYKDHITFHEFARRPLTTSAQRILHDALHLPYQAAFTLIAVCALAGCCYFLALISDAWNNDSGSGRIAIIAFLSSFTTLFAFLRPMHSYDEPLQFMLLLISIYCLDRNSNFVSILAFVTACITRETSFLLWPYFLWAAKKWKVAWWLAPPAFYVGWLLMAAPASLAEAITFTKSTRLLGWTENFAGLSRSIASVTNLILVVGLPLLLLWRHYYRFSQKDRLTIRIAVIVIAINSVMVFAFGLAREPRLFALPMILLWPLLPAPILQAYDDLRRSMPSKVFIGAVLSAAFAFAVYEPAGVRMGYLFQAYLALYLFIAWMVALLPKRAI